MHVSRISWLEATVSSLVFTFAPFGVCRSAEAFYVGAQIPYTVVQGDFDNVHAPEVGGALGLGVTFGYWLTQRIAVEASWAVSKHHSAGTTIAVEELSLNGRYALLTDDSLEPYALLGYGRFTLGDSSLTFGGGGMKFGLGLDWDPRSKVSQGVVLVRSIPSYDKIEKSDGPVILNGSLRGDMTSLIYRIRYHF
jgi:hypothetical protein